MPPPGLSVGREPIQYPLQPAVGRRNEQARPLTGTRRAPGCSHWGGGGLSYFPPQAMEAFAVITASRILRRAAV